MHCIAALFAGLQVCGKNHGTRAGLQMSVDKIFNYWPYYLYLATASLFLAVYPGKAKSTIKCNLTNCRFHLCADVLSCHSVKKTKCEKKSIFKSLTSGQRNCLNMWLPLPPQTYGRNSLFHKVIEINTYRLEEFKHTRSLILNLSYPSGPRPNCIP